MTTIRSAIARSPSSSPILSRSGRAAITALVPVRIVHHVFAEIALPPVGAGFGVLALDVAVLAAGDIFGRADRHLAAGLAILIVVAHALRDRRSPAFEATCQQRQC